jgi:hypothetical protein
VLEANATVGEAQRAAGAAMPAATVCQQLCSAEAAQGQEADVFAIVRLMLELSGAERPRTWRWPETGELVVRGVAGVMRRLVLYLDRLRSVRLG